MRSGTSTAAQKPSYVISAHELHLRVMNKQRADRNSHALVVGGAGSEQDGDLCSRDVINNDVVYSRHLINHDVVYPLPERHRPEKTTSSLIKRTRFAMEGDYLTS